MKTICCISDLHGNLPEIPECDILVIAGDICPVNDHSLDAQAKFLAGPFADWLSRVPASDVVAIWGNHDFIGERAPECVPPLRWHLLTDQAAVVQGIRFYGSPWQPWFWDWAFNAPKGQSESFLAEKFSLIPHDTDVLVVHGPPYTYGDVPFGGNATGSLALLDAIDARPAIMLSVHGHIHEGRGQWVRNNTTIVNASVLDRRYRMTHTPMIFHLKGGDNV